MKGESSGHHQRLVELRVDCDRDCLLALVEQEGPACHTNRRSCFYTAVRTVRRLSSWSLSTVDIPEPAFVIKDLSADVKNS